MKKNNVKPVASSAKIAGGAESGERPTKHADFYWRCSECNMAKDVTSERLFEERAYGSVLCDVCDIPMDRQLITMKLAGEAGDTSTVQSRKSNAAKPDKDAQGGQS